MERCDECKKGMLEQKQVDYELHGVNLGKFDAIVCMVCKETIFEGDIMQAIELAARQKKIWGIGA